MDKPITFNEWLGTQGNMVLLHANCCRIAFEGGQQSQQAKVEELQKRLDGALKETQYALQYVEEDMRGNHEFLQMAMIRTLKAIEQVLKGGA
ncbi:ORF1 [Acinetobacter baumannii]